MDLQPSLTGKLLLVRPLALADFEPLFEVASDPVIWDQHPFPRFEKNAFIEFFEQAEKSKSGLVVIDQATEEIVGASRYYNQKENQIAIGYTFLARSHWGGKFNRELKTLMIEHALLFVGEIFFDIGEHNLRSRRAIEKVGASFVSLQTINEKPYTLYKIDRTNFLAALGTRV
ncbi:MAG: GNAT family N-acetyltransferase [Pseudobdellovibrionaceae bacterium]